VGEFDGLEIGDPVGASVVGEDVGEFERLEVGIAVGVLVVGLDYWFLLGCR
jgi:hypothetical protein